MAGVENTHHKGAVLQVHAHEAFWPPQEPCPAVTTWWPQVGAISLSPFVTATEELHWSTGCTAVTESKISGAHGLFQDVFMLLTGYDCKKIPPQWGHCSGAQRLSQAQGNAEAPSSVAGIKAQRPRALAPRRWDSQPLWAPSNELRASLAWISKPGRFLLSHHGQLKASASFLGRRKLVCGAGSGDGTASSGRGQGQEFVFNLLLVYLSPGGRRIKAATERGRWCRKQGWLSVGQPTSLGRARKRLSCVLRWSQGVKNWYPEPAPW